MKPSHLLAAMVLLGCASLASTATAEKTLNLYMGTSFTADSTLDGTVGGLPAAAREVSWDNSIEAGIRASYWLEGGWNWLGIALDVSYFRPDVSSSSGAPVSALGSLHVIPVSPLLMVRAPLFVSERYTNGRIQPYIGAGAGFVTSVATSAGSSRRETDFDFGVDARLGLSILVRPRFGIFLEYRYTDVVVHNRDVFGDRIKTTLESDHLNAGVSLRF